ncbi:MAG: HlyD family efflux transporter periplasmic adaptor subunit [Gammaproteobacteria bacterium]
MKPGPAILLAVALAGCGGEGNGLPAVGTLERDRIEVVAEARETLVEVPVSEGDAVKAGDTVARQDDTRQQAIVARARAARDRAEARLAELVRGPRSEDITEARARLAGADTQAAADDREYTRIADLVERRLASPAELDGALSRRDASRAQRAEAAARLEALLEGTTIEELDQARAALEEARAALEEERVGLDRLTLRAPRDGQVDAIPYKQGDRPPPGAPVVVLLADQAPYARVYVPQAVRARVLPGLSARVTIAGVDGVFDGMVRYVSAEAAFTPYYALTERDRGRLTYVAEVTLEGDEARALPSGLPLEVDFPSLDGDGQGP